MIYDERPWLKHYDPGVSPEFVPTAGTLNDLFRKIGKDCAGLPAVLFHGVGLNYEELMAHADRFAQALIAHGLKPGDVVGLNLPNTPQYLIAQIGTLKAGCATTGVSPLLTPRELVYQLNDCQAKALVTLDAIFEHKLGGVWDQLPSLKLVAATNVVDFLPWVKRTLARALKKVPVGKVTDVPGKSVIQFMSILKDYPAEDPQVPVSPDDLCFVMYTGGTTGTPKGTLTTHRNMASELDIIVGQWLPMKLGKEVILSGFPYFHIAGLTLGLASVYAGSVQIIIPNPRDTGHIVKEMAKYRPTVVVNVPSLYMMLMENPDFHKLDFSRLNFSISAAAPFPADLLPQLEAVIGEGKLVEAYGMTEVSSLATANPVRGKKKVGSIGVPLPSTRIRLVDLDTAAKEVPVGQEGEILVSGPQVTKGYLNRPDETALALRELDGEIWLRTGDVARMDEDGFFELVDRAKDMLNVGGFKVFSREVEEKFYEHPAVDLCAIVGRPNEKRPGTDIVKLVVQLAPAGRDREGEEVKAELTAFARENLAPFKVPKIIEFVDQIPLTSVGKVDKKALRQ